MRSDKCGSYSVSLTLPNVLLEKWTSLEENGSADFTAMKSGVCDVAVSFVKTASDTKIKVTGLDKKYTQQTNGDFICIVTCGSDQASQSPIKRYRSTRLSASRQAEEESVKPGAKTAPLRDTESNAAIRRSSRTKKEVVNKDFVVPTKRRKLITADREEEVKVVAKTDEPGKDGKGHQVQQEISQAQVFRDAMLSSSPSVMKVEEMEAQSDKNVDTPLPNPIYGETVPEEHTQNTTECSLCFITFENVTKLTRHINEHHKNHDQVQMKASELSQRLQAQESHLESTMDVSSGDKPNLKQEGKSVCIICDRTVKSLQQHVKLLHKMTSTEYRKLHNSENNEKLVELKADFRKKKIKALTKTKRGIPIRPRRSVNSVSKVKNQPTFSDAWLSSRSNNDMECLLCRKSFIGQKTFSNFKNHLYTAHKLSHSDHSKVLDHDDLSSRKAALDKLIELSKNQMKRSGQHCPFCYILCIGTKRLLSHVVVHSDDPDYQKNLEELLKHLQRTKELTPSAQKPHIKDENKGIKKENGEEVEGLRCLVCGNVFDCIEHLRRHLNVLHDMRWVDYTSLILLPDQEKDARIAEIKNHPPNDKRKQGKKDVDMDSQVIKCANCFEMIPCKEYRDHLTNHHMELFDIDEVVEQMKAALTGSSYRAIHDFDVSCPVCGEINRCIPSIKHFKIHHAQVHDYESKLADLQSEIRLRANQNRAKAREERMLLDIKYPCRYCKAIFHDMSSKSEHQNYKCKENTDRKRLYTCKVCGQKGTSEEWYTSHIKQHDFKGHNYTCFICGKGYTNRSGLQSHKAIAHEKKVKFDCKVCKKVFYGSSHYEKHMLKHSSERNFKCDVCEKTFKSGSCVIRHKRTVHEKRYLYQCGKCDYSADKLHTLSKHRCRSLTSESTDNPPINSATESSVTIIMPMAPKKTPVPSLPTCTTEVVHSTLPEVKPASSLSETPTILPTVSTSRVPKQGDSGTSVTPQQRPHLVSLLPPKLTSIISNTASASLLPAEAQHSDFSKQIMTEENDFSNQLLLTSPKSILPGNLQLTGPVDNLQAAQFDLSQAAQSKDDSQLFISHPDTAYVQTQLLASTADMDKPLMAAAQDFMESDSHQVISTADIDSENLRLIQEVFVDGSGNILGTSGNVPGMDQQVLDVGDGADQLQNIILVKDEAAGATGESTVLELQSLIWMNTDSEQT